MNDNTFNITYIEHIYNDSDLFYNTPAHTQRNVWIVSIGSEERLILLHMTYAGIKSGATTTQLQSTSLRETLLPCTAFIRSGVNFIKYNQLLVTMTY